MAKFWGMERYKGFLIVGTTTPNFATRFDWYSQGIILRPARLGSVIEVKRLTGAVFNSKDAAEEDGLQLCREWIDRRP
jgi:hypothetical protein